MSTEANKELTVKIFEALTNSDWDFIRNAYADDAKIWVAGNTPISGNHGKEFLDQLDAGNKEIFPNGIRLEVTAMTAEGDRVAAELVSHGDHVNGKKYNNHYHVLMVIRDGKVVDYKEYMDTAHLTETFFQE